MNTGDDTSYYLSGGYQVIAIEANPFLVKKATLKFGKEIENKSLVLIDKGISDTEGKITFFINKDNSEWSSFDKDTASRMNTAISQQKVDCITLQSLFDKYGVPFFLKIDIENYDKFCIESILGEDRPKYVSCESGAIDLLDILYQKGYTKFKMINQANGFGNFNYLEEKLYLPSFVRKIMWRLRKLLFPFTINYGSSGPWGEFTKGQWQTIEETKRDFILSHNSRGELINKLSWYDFHATY